MKTDLYSPNIDLNFDPGDESFHCLCEVFNYAPGKAVSVVGVENNALLQVKVQEISKTTADTKFT